MDIETLAQVLDRKISLTQQDRSRLVEQMQDSARRGFPTIRAVTDNTLALAQIDARLDALREMRALVGV